MKTKWYKIVVWILIGLVALFFILALWYKYEYSMERVTPYSVYSNSFQNRLLIATQGSAFKNALVQEVIDHYGNDSLFIEIMDVSGLSETEPSVYTAILVLHTWEYDKPPKVVAQFIKDNKGHLQHLVVFSTSGEGDNRMDGVDGLAGESLMAEVPTFSSQIIDKLDAVMQLGT